MKDLKSGIEAIQKNIAKLVGVEEKAESVAENAKAFHENTSELAHRLEGEEKKLDQAIKTLGAVAIGTLLLALCGLSAVSAAFGVIGLGKFAYEHYKGSSQGAEKGA